MRYVFLALLVTLSVPAAAPQAGGPARTVFEELASTERAFVQLAQETNWKTAFLAYFADGIRGFEGEDVKEDLRKQPDPPAGLEFWWEPRYGDIAASGELGWLTGPVRIVPPDAKDKKPRFSNYASVWKRQPDGSFKVILDVGIPTPDMVPFPPGVTRVPMSNRYSGPHNPESAKASLQDADATLTNALKTKGDQAEAFAPAMAAFARFHRPRVMPLTERHSSLEWLKAQPAWTQGESRFAEAARSGDLGYTWGSYSAPTGQNGAAETGHYVRVWSRDAAGGWHLVLDVLQPKRPPQP